MLPSRLPSVRQSTVGESGEGDGECRGDGGGETERAGEIGCIDMKRGVDVATARLAFLSDAMVQSEDGGWLGAANLSGSYVQTSGELGEQPRVYRW
jgi:hypothetical protein